MLFAQLPRNLEAAFRDAADPKPAVRASALRDLVRHVDGARSRVIAALETALQDSAPMVRETAADALGDVDGVEAIEKLLDAVEDADQLVRQKAISTLGLLKDARAETRLARALKDARPEVRYQAVMAYPRVVADPADAERALVQATRDEDPFVVHVAFRMAEELADGAPISEAIVQRARACLAHDSARVQAVAAVVLGTAGDAQGDATLRALVDGSLKTDEPEDLAAAIDLCGERKLTGATAALEKRAFGGFFSKDRFRWHARCALAAMGHDRARSEIMGELDSRSFDRRTLAVSAAARAKLKEATARIAAMEGHPDRAEPSAVEAALESLRGTESTRG